MSETGPRILPGTGHSVAMEVDDTGLVVCEAILDFNEMKAAKAITDILSESTAERRAEIVKMVNSLVADLPLEAKGG